MFLIWCADWFQWKYSVSFVLAELCSKTWKNNFDIPKLVNENFHFSTIQIIKFAVLSNRSRVHD